MNNDSQKSEISELHEKIQSGRLVIGFSSAIPGFVKKDPSHKAISFAPFYARDSWVHLPIAIIQELAPATNGTLKEHLPLSFSLKPGGGKEQVLIDLIDALTKGGPSPANGNGVKIGAAEPAAGGGQGICCKCTLGDESCVDCYLSI